MVIKHLKSDLDVMVKSLWDIMSALSQVEVVTCKVASNSRGICKELAGLFRLVRDQVSDM